MRGKKLLSKAAQVESRPLNPLAKELLKNLENIQVEINPLLGTISLNETVKGVKIVIYKIDNEQRESPPLRKT